MSSRLTRGFSLLEAIVALAIVATAGLALFAAMNQSLEMTMRAENARKQDSALRNALAWMETVNPALDPVGEQRIGNLDIAWQAEPIEPPQNDYMQTGLYEIGLYEVQLRVHTNDNVDATFHVRKVGYKQVRKPGMQ